MKETTWRRRTGPTLLVASILFLVAYSWRVITEAGPTEEMLANVVIGISWVMFAVDYVVRLGLARGQRWLWFRTHLADLAILVLPVLRLVRVMRVFTRLPGVRRTRAAELRTRIMVYGLASALMLVYIASLQALAAERQAPGATIVSFGDALWWACVSATTTGYGDLTPVTVTGRVVGVVLMCGGVALAGIITATLASWVFERGAHGDDSGDAATKGEIRALRQEILALRTALAERGEEHRDQGPEGGPIP